MPQEKEEKEEEDWGKNNDLNRHKMIVRRRKDEFDNSRVGIFLWPEEERQPFPFPREITFDIISRLPFESILDCRQVCKTWRNYILLTSFADFHLRRRLHCGGLSPPPWPVDHCTCDDGKVGFLFLTMEKSSYLYYGEYNENGGNQSSYMTVEKINHSKFKKRRNTSAIVGSCNGLICSSMPYSFCIDDPVYIFNPITKEFLYIPRFDMPNECRKTIVNKRSYAEFFMVSGFGYHQATDLYEIVRIFYCSEQQPVVGQVQIYTLGSEVGWRNKGEISYSLYDWSYGPSRGVLAYGALHWMDYKKWKIVVFDLENEEFSLLSSLPCPNPNNFQIYELGGCLCVAHENVGESFDIWSFKKKTGEWERVFKIGVSNGKPIDVYWPIAFTMNGELLLRYDSKCLIRYNPRTATIKKIADLTTDLASEQCSLLLVEAIACWIKSYFQY